MRRAKQHTHHVETSHCGVSTTPISTRTQHVASLQTDANHNMTIPYTETNVRATTNTCLCGLDPQSHPAKTKNDRMRCRIKFGKTQSRWLFQTLCCVLLLFLVACQQETLEGIGGGEGTLVLDGLRKQATQADSLLTKAVDNDLYVEIWQGENMLQQYEPGETPSQIKLEDGSYRLKSYNAAALTSTVTGKGEPIYTLAEKPFDITAGEINRIDAIVPMINVGIRLANELPSQFTNYQLTVQQGDRSVSLKQGDVAYFMAGEQLLYTLSALNEDGESCVKPGSLQSSVAGTIYEINYTFATKGDILHE